MCKNMASATNFGPSTSAGHSWNSTHVKHDSSTINTVNTNTKVAYNILKQLKVKIINKLEIANFNINSIDPKFDQLKELISDNIDVLVITETKMYNGFPSWQFAINYYSVPLIWQKSLGVRCTYLCKRK